MQFEHVFDVFAKTADRLFEFRTPGRIHAENQTTQLNHYPHPGCDFSKTNSPDGQQ